MKKISVFLTLLLILSLAPIPNYASSTYTEDPLRPIHKIQQKVIPTIVYAQLLCNSNGFKKNEYVEILEDVQNGSTYKATNGVITTWVYANQVSLIPYDTSALPPISFEEVELYINHIAPTSPTHFYIWVDLARQKVNVLQQIEPMHWELVQCFTCSSGKLSTPTVRGTFAINGRGQLLNCREKAKYWVKFYNNYLFHSLPLTDNLTPISAPLGTPSSNGCIRMSEQDALWFYLTIPDATPVWIY